MIPVSTTTIAVYRAAENEPGEGRTFTRVATGVRANIGALTGTEITRPGGGEMVAVGRLDCDPTDIAHTDQILDENTSERFEVLWVKKKLGLGLDHIEGSVALVQGAVA
jgi:hypothetical protein